MTAKVQELYDFLLPDERKELDAHLIALKDTPKPDEAYQKDPIGWMRDKLGIPEEQIRWSKLPEYAFHIWDGTVDPLAVVCEAIAEGRDCGVESATGTGKTYLAAALCLWFVACFSDALVVTTAPKEGQLTAQLWKEIGRQWPRFEAAYPWATKVTLRVRLKEGAGEQETWAIIGWACGVGSVEESATKAQGFHAAHMLVVTEETPGIDPAVMTAFKNTSVGEHNVRLALGNPDHRSDSLHRFCGEKDVVPVRISAYDHPNVVCGREVIPGAVSRKSIASKREDYGSDDHPMFKSRVRGLCPEEGTVPFPRAMVERCDTPLSDDTAVVWGWDLARAQDETVGVPLDKAGVVTKAWQRWALIDWPEQVKRIQAMMQQTPATVDSTGVGDPIVQFLQERSRFATGYAFTDRSRQELLERLQGALQNQEVRGPFKEGGKLAWVTQQLESFEFIYTASGVRFRAPDDQLDDGVMALALAVYTFDQYGYLAKLRTPAQQPQVKVIRDDTDLTPDEEVYAGPPSTGSGSMNWLPGEDW
ncbi:MAG: hypothetical protein ACR652_24420 [Methylocystis sp.]|uniref:hypothetical protein n=1 Tax=Methylocystis sp. TaxID=1911079 RepID=UPI003DA2164D